MLRNAIARSSAKRFLVDGYPRIVSDGFPSVQDQVFAFEDLIGKIGSVIVLDAPQDARVSRQMSGGTGVLTPGQAKLLAASTEAFTREKVKILDFFDKLGIVKRVRRIVCVSHASRACADVLRRVVDRSTRAPRRWTLCLRRRPSC